MPTSEEARVLLHDVWWDDYESVLKQIVEKGRRLFVTYDGKNLEVMVPSMEHHCASERLSTIVWLLAEELQVAFRSLGSTTFPGTSIKQGLEPDKCFYTKNELKIRSKKRIDLRRDPPPDLAIEIEITTRLLDRVAIYAALGVPELWRYDGKRLRVFVLSRGRYRERDHSPTFPNVPLQQIEQWLRSNIAMDEITWTKQIRAWVRKHLVAK